MPWFAIYTRPKNEKKVTKSLEKMGVEVFCPMITQVKQWSDRKKKVKVPLINSYVFVNIEEKDRNVVFQVSGVVRYLFWLGKPAVIKEYDIEVLKDSLLGIFNSFEVNKLKSGDQLTISKGPFYGKEGVVFQVDKNRIKLILKELGVIITISKEG
jgi:transcription antitermination factor NusG